MVMRAFIQTLRLLLTSERPERRQVIAWIISLLIALVTTFIIHRHGYNQNFYNYAIGLYLLDSVMFFVLLFEGPRLRLAGSEQIFSLSNANRIKLVLLTFIFFLEIAVAGYYFLIAARPF